MFSYGNRFKEQLKSYQQKEKIMNYSKIVCQTNNTHYNITAFHLLKNNRLRKIFFTVQCFKHFYNPRSLTISSIENYRLLIKFNKNTREKILIYTITLKIFHYPFRTRKRTTMII